MNFLLLIFVYWEYPGQQNFMESLMTNQEQPVFAAIISTKSRLCRGVQQKFIRYADSIGERSQIQFTVIDCAHREFCAVSKIMNLPKFVLIRTPHQRYWRYTEETDPAGWNSFIMQETRPILYENVTNITDLSERLKYGGSHFHISLRNTTDESKLKENNEIIEALKETSSIYRMYNTSFSYSYNNSSNNTITWYYSKTCAQTTQASSNQIREFVSNHLFSAYHHYDYDEFSEMKQGYLILYVGQESKIYDGMKRIDSLIAASGCNPKKKYGIASIISDRYASEASFKLYSMDSFVVGFNLETECYVTAKSNSTSEEEDYDFFADLESSTKCKKNGKILSKAGQYHNGFLFAIIILVMIALSITALLIQVFVIYNPKLA